MGSEFMTKKNETILDDNSDGVVYIEEALNNDDTTRPLKTPHLDEKTIATVKKIPSDGRYSLFKDKTKANEGDVYHIIRRDDLAIYEIRRLKDEYPLKIFGREIEAIEYGKLLIKNFGVSVLLHGRDGKVRTL